MANLNEKIDAVWLSEFRPEWSSMFISAADEIKSILKDNCLQAHHIGSTAIPNIYAKPIIDVLVVVQDINLVDSLNNKFNELGYICKGEYGIPGRRYYWKFRNIRTHNIHLFEYKSREIARYLAFKDFLITHPDFGQAYSFIKQSLAEVFTHDIDNYVNGKASFIQMIYYKTKTASEEQLTAKDNIVIEPYNSVWPKLAAAEMKAIQMVTKQIPYITMEHIGSTAVNALASEPVIDIFIALSSINEAKQWIKPLETLGYVFWDDNLDKSHLHFFKGMPPFGIKRTHHVHIVEITNSAFGQRILFRDVLRLNDKIRMEYEAFKFKLASLSLDREAYLAKKHEFIEKVLRRDG